jgi:hypothetical protein
MSSNGLVTNAATPPAIEAITAFYLVLKSFVGLNGL